MGPFLTREGLQEQSEKGEVGGGTRYSSLGRHRLTLPLLGPVFVRCFVLMYAIYTSCCSCGCCFLNTFDCYVKKKKKF